MQAMRTDLKCKAESQTHKISVLVSVRRRKAFVGLSLIRCLAKSLPK